jgi:hypothetical protein
MRLLHKAASLVRRCELNRRLSEAGIASLQEKMAEIDRQVAELDMQCDVLLAMLHQQQQPGTVDRAGLFAMQQRNAVCRQKRQMLDLQRTELQEQYGLLRRQQEEERLMRLQWQRKGDKFQACVRKERQQMRLKQTLQEESEIQEKQAWRK